VSNDGVHHGANTAHVTDIGVQEDGEVARKDPRRPEDPHQRRVVIGGDAWQYPKPHAESHSFE
jgi:hypothetical protein